MSNSVRLIYLLSTANNGSSGRVEHPLQMSNNMISRSGQTLGKFPNLGAIYIRSDDVGVKRRQSKANPAFLSFLLSLHHSRHNYHTNYHHHPSMSRPTPIPIRRERAASVDSDMPGLSPTSATSQSPPQVSERLTCIFQ
jgi:hypothetical protein